jgi:hypothetical protein
MERWRGAKPQHNDAFNGDDLYGELHDAVSANDSGNSIGRWQRHPELFKRMLV